mmetsp:Transcript_50854/g.149858  ORF Transcript_50854/g.149858 Transcript_50854/m.149858 type:complete len:207 (+) Transcript_50854:61-681(+)
MISLYFFSARFTSNHSWNMSTHVQRVPFSLRVAMPSSRWRTPSQASTASKLSNVLKLPAMVSTWCRPSSCSTTSNLHRSQKGNLLIQLCWKEMKPRSAQERSIPQLYAPKATYWRSRRYRPCCSSTPASEQVPAPESRMLFTRRDRSSLRRAAPLFHSFWVATAPVYLCCSTDVNPSGFVENTFPTGKVLRRPRTKDFSRRMPAFR